jgi:hypothetical protein
MDFADKFLKLRSANWLRQRGTMNIALSVGKSGKIGFFHTKSGREVANSTGGVSVQAPMGAA